MNTQDIRNDQVVKICLATLENHVFLYLPYLFIGPVYSVQLRFKTKLSFTISQIY